MSIGLNYRMALGVDTRPSRWSVRVLKVVMALLCALVAAYALMLLLVAPLRPPLMQDRFSTHPVSTSMHLALGALVIVLAPLQLSVRLRRRNRAIHRWTGRAYAVGVLFSGLAGLALARISQGGAPAHLGFGLLSLLWMLTTYKGVERIRAGDVAGHRRWMIHSFALTFAAVMLRIYVPLAYMAGLPVELSYQVIAWLCWVPNLVVAVWVTRSRLPEARRGSGRKRMMREA